jgi:hypothetical protein
MPIKASELNQIRVEPDLYAALAEIKAACGFKASLVMLANHAMRRGLDQTRAIFCPSPLPGVPVKPTSKKKG